jgi:hypothetical protein
MPALAGRQFFLPTAGKRKMLLFIKNSTPKIVKFYLFSEKFENSEN